MWVPQGSTTHKHTKFPPMTVFAPLPSPPHPLGKQITILSGPLSWGYGLTQSGCVVQPSEYGCTECLEHKGSTGVHTPRSNNKCSVTTIYVDFFYAFRCLLFVVNYVWVQGVAGSSKQVGLFGQVWGFFSEEWGAVGKKRAGVSIGRGGVDEIVGRGVFW